MSLPRYVRETEHAATAPAPVVETLIPRTDVATRAAHSPLSPGAQDLLTGLCRLARPSVFPGGGVGIEYSALLKSAVNPAYLQRHAQEAAAHLREQRVDLLLVPGMSGYPVGSVYASVSGIPAVLLKKQAVPADRGDLPAYPVGSFISSSYTGDGDVVMSADPGAVQDTIDHILTSQVAAQADRPRLRLELRLAGADDIIDKGVMSRAVSESGIVLSRSAARTFLDRYRRRPRRGRLGVVRRMGHAAHQELQPSERAARTADRGHAVRRPHDHDRTDRPAGNRRRESGLDRLLIGKRLHRRDSCTALRRSSCANRRVPVLPRGPWRTGPGVPLLARRTTPSLRMPAPRAPQPRRLPTPRYAHRHPHTGLSVQGSGNALAASARRPGATRTRGGGRRGESAPTHGDHNHREQQRGEPPTDRT